MRQGMVARGIVLALLSFLVIPLYKLQVRSSAEFSLQAEQNRMRPLVVRAPRGTIYDRRGRIVAENIVGYEVLLMPAPIEQLRDKVTRLAPVLGMDSAAVASAFGRYRRAPHLPMVVHGDASPEAVARLEERRYEFQEVLVQEYPKRNYPAGPAIAHFIGYIGEINEDQLASPDWEGYEQGRWIGKAGLERHYEKYIGGEPGVRFLEIDARGRIKRWLSEELGRPPVPGKDLHLYLDLDLQEFIAHIFPKDYTGAFVAMDPETGGVLAYYSNPSYDPNDFVGRIPIDIWRSLQDDPRKPLVDRVVGSGQPAASTWKLAVAGMALDVGAIRPDEYMPIACSGGMNYGGRYWRCWNRSGHGRMNLIEGIKNSCNVYFYQVGLRIGLDRFLETGVRLGFNKKTGIDVPHEITPHFPESRDLWRRRFGYSAREGEVLSMAIGQGPLTMTAIKLAHIYTSLGREDGRVPAPRLARDMDVQRDTFQFKLDPYDVWFLEAGMRRVVGPGGTAALSRLRDWEFIGKTGTAQNPPNKDHAWFVGMGGPPGGKPEIAVTMFLEFGEHGYLASGFVAEAINFYLDRKYGKPFQEWATPRHRLARGLPINWNWNIPIVDPPIPEEARATAASEAEGAAVAGRGTGGGR
jgi:penicillin-binding protein 2